MIELARIIGEETGYSYRATKSEQYANQLDLLLKTNHNQWHPYIAGSFIHSPPHKEARFRPYNGRNVFYGSLFEETALFETAFYIMKERFHLQNMETGSRTIFFVEADDKKALDLSLNKNISNIMLKDNHSASHQFILNNPEETFLLYPSCRDPQHRNNVAILDINHLKKNIIWQSALRFYYDHRAKQLTWINYPFHVGWEEVSSSATHVFKAIP